MKIVVLNGSPKGITSVTMQYVTFLQRKFPRHDFTFFHVGQQIGRLERDERRFAELAQAVEGADAVLWAFPLYYLLVPAQYKRFIELVEERGASSAFRDKYAAVLSTSIHFFDHTAHEYMHAVCDDLGMKYWGSFSAEMYDLLKEAERHRLRLFAEGLLDAVEKQVAVPRTHRPVEEGQFKYCPASPGVKVATQGKKVIIVTDAESSDQNLRNMVARLERCFSDGIEVINLHEIEIRGGCLGCIQCGVDNVCVYRDADDIRRIYGNLQSADVLVMAGRVSGRFLSSRWKLFIDRGFFNNHVPIFTGKQMGYLVAGPLGQVSNLREVLKAYAECQRANLAGIVTDECGDSHQLDRLLDDFARRIIDCAVSGYVQPPTFRRVAGEKLFRDEIWSRLRIAFRADHHHYRAHGFYNFPKRSLRNRVREAVIGLLLHIPGFRREFKKRVKKEMVRPFEEVVRDA
jgi:multimeric flavodoxin WrbA